MRAQDRIVSKLLLGSAFLAGQAVWAAGTLSPPVSGVYLGIWANPALAPNPEAAIEIREGPPPNGINRPFALHLHYYGWNELAQELDNGGLFHPDAELLGDLTRGRVPVISWACDGKVANSDHLIGAGDTHEDTVIVATAKALAQYPGPILLRWFWEFNVLASNQNCRGDNGAPPTQRVYSDFIGAWQHIRGLFQSAGATNVLFLWNPGQYGAGGGPDDPHSFYPGNDSVDWIGIDTYQRSATATFDDDFGLFYNDFSQSQYGNKPLMAGENGAQNFVQNSRERQWTYLQGLLTDAKANRYPQLKAYCYFDAVGAAGDWVLDDNSGQGFGGFAGFAALAASGLFSPPGITLVANAEGESPTIAPNTWVEIKGVNLAPPGDTGIWQASEFVDHKMPVQLDGVSATVNGKPAYVYFISPTQINVLTPPDAMQGAVQVKVANNGATTAAYTAQGQPASPSWFVFNGGPYVAATHADGTFLGPTSLYPGSTTPAKPGESVMLYANGFGPTSTPIESGSAMQSGGLSPLPVVKIGGVASTVQFAGLVEPGQFQFNVTVPASLADGDQPITATYNGLTTQPGTLLTIRH